MTTISASVLNKYNVAVPRYTSYPTVPFWSSETPDVTVWKEVVQETFMATNSSEGISLYLHLPFCESLCTYCGCNKRITKNHSVEPIYLRAILKEWTMYRALFPEKPIIREIHLGGGTPTFFSPENLTFLMTNILEGCDIHPEYEFSFEGHPNNTTREHLQALYNVGFRRVSYGVQDLSEKVQIAINRLQPYENLVEATNLSREIGYTSVNFDLIYGLPFQTPESIKDTFEKVILLQPDRIAYYSYAHVPWKQKSQRAYSEEDLPQESEKYKLYCIGKEMLQKDGYLDVGMDHFAKETDELFIAKKEGRLHRNFMGYTTNQTSLMIGLGVSSISDSYKGYWQNVKTIEEYYDMLRQDLLPGFKSYFHTDTDVVMRRHILDIACKGENSWLFSPAHDIIQEQLWDNLLDLEADGLIVLEPNKLTLTELGYSFIRNIAAVFDLKMAEVAGEKTETPMFSKAV